jgi:hypothetical protein
MTHKFEEETYLEKDTGYINKFEKISKITPTNIDKEKSSVYLMRKIRVT